MDITSSNRMQTPHLDPKWCINYHLLDCDDLRVIFVMKPSIEIHFLMILKRCVAMCLCISRI